MAGMTLIELMIAVAIVGIIAAVGYPSYQSMITSSYRGTAQSDLLGLASAMERHYNANFTYLGAAESGANTGKPAAFATHSPAAEPQADRLYDLTIAAVSGQGSSYEIRATPVSGSKQATDGTLYYFSDGRKAWDKDNNGSVSSAEFCWNC
jgi:type IV pilus assembly protein PilE